MMCTIFRFYRTRRMRPTTAQGNLDTLACGMIKPCDAVSAKASGRRNDEQTWPIDVRGVRHVSGRFE
jgi:hypothetical protein